MYLFLAGRVERDLVGDFEDLLQQERSAGSGEPHFGCEFRPLGFWQGLDFQFETQRGRNNDMPCIVDLEALEDMLL